MEDDIAEWVSTREGAETCEGMSALWTPSVQVAALLIMHVTGDDMLTPGADPPSSSGAVHDSAIDLVVTSPKVTSVGESGSRALLVTSTLPETAPSPITF